MKKARQQFILKTISEGKVKTQEELLAILQNVGYKATQATVSRDIRELNLVKMRTADGESHYVRHEVAENPGENKYAQIMRSAVLSVDYACNIVVIRCSVGMANAACAALDTLSLEEHIVGTLAGDDTIFALTRSERNAKLLAADLRTLLSLN